MSGLLSKADAGAAGKDPLTSLPTNCNGVGVVGLIGGCVMFGGGLMVVVVDGLGGALSTKHWR